MLCFLCKCFRMKRRLFVNYFSLVISLATIRTSYQHPPLCLLALLASHYLILFSLQFRNPPPSLSLSTHEIFTHIFPHCVLGSYFLWMSTYIVWQVTSFHFAVITSYLINAFNERRTSVFFRSFSPFKMENKNLNFSFPVWFSSFH